MTLSNVLLRKALKAARLGDPDTARQLLLELLQGDPRNEVAWFWLSRVTRDPDEKRTALQQALRIRPAWPEANHALQTLEEEQLQQSLATWQVELTDLYAAAKQAVKNGRRRDGLQLLRQLVAHQPEHEYGWLAISRLSPDAVERFMALEKAYAINPSRKQTAVRLKEARRQIKSTFALGQAYEAEGALARARDAFKQARKEARSRFERTLTEERLQLVEKKLRQQQVVVTTPTTTLLRLAFGPMALYGLLLLIQGGLNPLHIPPLLYLGTLIVLLGSLLITGIHNTPHHGLWSRILDEEELNGRLTRALISVLGMLLVAVPFLMLLISSLNRLEVLRASIY